jgi:hypothetical protein
MNKTGIFASQKMTHSSGAQILPLKVDRNTLSLGWWIPSDRQHPDFVEQRGPSSQSATVQIGSTHASETQTPAHEEFLSMALQEVA